jgi:hypothetical protein
MDYGENKYPIFVIGGAAMTRPTKVWYCKRGKNYIRNETIKCGSLGCGNEMCNKCDTTRYKVVRERKGK